MAGIIKNSVTWERSKRRKLGWLVKKIQQDKIEVMENFLNRLLFDDPWLKNDNQKSFEYLDSFLHGAWNVEKFIFVTCELIKKQIELKMEIEEDGDVLEMLKLGLDVINDKIDRKVELLVIDGQGRSFTTIRPYFRSKENLRIPLVSDKRIDAITIEYEDGTEEELNGKVYCDLSSKGKRTIMNHSIDTATIIDGDLNQIIKCLVAKNCNEKWSPWQQLFHGVYISSFSLNIKKVLTEPVSDFLKAHTNIERSAFKYAVSGNELFISKLLYYLATQSVPSVTNAEISEGFKRAFEPNSGIIKPLHVEKLKQYITELIDTFPNTGKKDFNIYAVRNYIILRDAIDNRTKKDFYYQMVAGDMKDLKGKIIDNNGIVNWFVKKHQWLDAKWHFPVGKDGKTTKELNILSWTDVDTPLTEGYHQSTSSDNDVNFKKALKHLVREFIGDISKLEKDLIWKFTTRSQTPTIIDVAVYRKYEDRHGNPVNPLRLKNDYEKGHIKDEKHGGTEELENLVLQKIKGNKQYGARHLIN